MAPITWHQPHLRLSFCGFERRCCLTGTPLGPGLPFVLVGRHFVSAILLISFLRGHCPRRWALAGLIWSRLGAIQILLEAGLGSGFSEDVYDRTMQVWLRLAKIGYEGQKVVELKYKDHYVGEGD